MIEASRRPFSDWVRGHPGRALLFGFVLALVVLAGGNILLGLLEARSIVRVVVACCMLTFLAASVVMLVVFAHHSKKDEMQYKLRLLAEDRAREAAEEKEAD